MNMLYTIGVHNAHVRAAENRGSAHAVLSPLWAHTNYIDVEADTRDAALAQIEQRLPYREGFVVDEIEPRHHFGWNGDGI